MRIGFAGLGRMGQRMAANCVRAGHKVTVWNRSSEAAETFADKYGTTVDAAPAGLCVGTDVVITMLANDEAARTVYLGSDGLIVSPGADLLVEMGTMSPELTAELASAAQQAGKVFVDAPVSGSTSAAEEAGLLIMVGADESLAARLSPLFDAMGSKTIWLGQTGAGSAMKLAVNMLIHGMNQTVSESLMLAESAGIPIDRAFDVIENSAAAAPMLRYRRPIYLDEQSHDVTFTVELASKDLHLALGLAAGKGISLPQTRLTKTIVDDAIDAGFGRRDMASIFNYMRERRS